MINNIILKKKNLTSKHALLTGSIVEVGYKGNKEIYLVGCCGHTKTGIEYRMFGIPDGNRLFESGMSLNELRNQLIKSGYKYRVIDNLELKEI